MTLEDKVKEALENGDSIITEIIVDKLDEADVKAEVKEAAKDLAESINIEPKKDNNSDKKNNSGIQITVVGKIPLEDKKSKDKKDNKNNKHNNNNNSVKPVNKPQEKQNVKPQQPQAVKPEVKNVQQQENKNANVAQNKPKEVKEEKPKTKRTRKAKPLKKIWTIYKWKAKAKKNS